MKGIKFMNAAVMCLVVLSGTAFAQDAAFELPRVSDAYIKDYDSFKLAANDQESGSKSGSASVVKNSTFEEPMITGGKVHQYLGWSTIVLAGMTALTAPGSSEGAVTTQPRQTNGTHAKLAEAAVLMAGATIITGLITHWDDFHVADGIADPDNQHILLGVTGAAMMAYAVNKSKNSAVPVSHAGIAELGALLMVAAIKITW